MYSNDGTGTSLISNGTITGIAWNHVALSWNRDSATGAKLYINGILDAERDGTPEAGTLTNASYGILIGARRTTSSTIAQYWNGYIKNVAIWERALSATEVQNVMYKSYTDLSGTLTSGLKGWWALEGDYLDSTNNDNDGTNNGSTANTSLYGGITPLIPRGVDNAPVVQADAIGTGYASFDGDSDNISFTELVLDTDGNCSVVFWAKRISTGDDAILAHTSSTSEKTIRFSSGHDLELESDTNGDTATVTLHTEDTGVWHHYALVCTSGTLTAYQDGISCSVANAGMSDDTTINCVGGDGTDGDSSNFQGQLKNIGIWKDNSLTQAQIQSIMEKTYSELTSSEKTNLTSWWGLDSVVAPIVGDTPALVEDEHDTTLGSDVVVNGGFDTDSTWAKGTGWTISGGTASSDGTQSDYSNLNQTSILTVGQVYKVQFNITEISAGHFRPSIQTSTTVFGDSYTTSGVKTWYVKATGTDLKLQANADFIGSIDDVSVKPFDGNYGELK
jgi:hypothetical protein